MLTLANAHLCLDVLDPVADRARLGPRFCWGGFIWQVHDVVLGPLLTGPEWPAPAPTPFNGQGLPESFRHRTREGRPLTWQGERGVALGAGELALTATGEAAVTAPCAWEIGEFADRLVFSTWHAAAGFSYELTRQIELTDRKIVSRSALTNTSDRRLTLEWFAHPFFALTDGLIHAEVPEGATLPENPGFALADRALTQRRRFAHAKDGHMDYLQLPPGQPLVVRLNHPLLTHISFATNFPPGECVIWGNSNTFSVEPYLALDLAPGETRSWSLRYGFGASSGIASPALSSHTPLAR